MKLTGPIAWLARETTDHRMIGELVIGAMPLPLMMLSATQDFGGHSGAARVGSVDQVSFAAAVNATGRLFSDTEGIAAGARFKDAPGRRLACGIDLTDIETEEAGDLCIIRGRLAAVTLYPVGTAPAFPDAYLEVVGE